MLIRDAHRKPLAESSEEPPRSNYTGYARRTRREDWIDYDQQHWYLAARNGGHPEADLAWSFTKRLGSALSIGWRRDELPEPEQERTTVLVSEKFATDPWSERR